MFATTSASILTGIYDVRWEISTGHLYGISFSYHTYPNGVHPSDEQSRLIGPVQITTEVCQSASVMCIKHKGSRLSGGV